MRGRFSKDDGSPDSERIFLSGGKFTYKNGDGKYYVICPGCEKERPAVPSKVMNPGWWWPDTFMMVGFPGDIRRVCSAECGILFCNRLIARGGK